MDPEDLREVIAAYQNCVAETVQRFGGFVAKYMGDGVLAKVYEQTKAERALLKIAGGLLKKDPYMLSGPDTVLGVGLGTLL